MTGFRDEELATTLSELRPTPSAEFAAELDARVEAGFRRAPRSDSAPAKLLARLRSTRPRRLLLPVGGVALATVVVATAVVAIGGSDVDRKPAAHATEHLSSRAPAAPGGAITDRAAASSAQNSADTGGPPQASGESAMGSSGSAYEVKAPGSGKAARSGPYAARHDARDIERGASMTLSDDPSKVRADAGQVFEAVHAANGIVLHSTIRDGSSSAAGAEFELLIPTARLGDAMAAFAGIAGVRSRHESTADITAPTVSAQEHLQDSAARVEGLLTQLANADTDAERAAVEMDLRAERNRMAALRSRLSGLERRANLSHVTLRIATGPGASEGSGGGWGVGDGFGDAGRILAVAAGVSVIALAALAPLAIVALLAWLARAAWVRTRRRAALSRA